MKIRLINNKLLLEKIEIKKVNKVVKALLEKENKELEKIQLILIKDEEILKINKKFLKHHYCTDVIAFNYNKKKKISGDIFISVDRIKSNAIKYNTNFRDELFRVIVHGILHLAGYNDNNELEKKEMSELEDFYIKYMQ